MSHLLRVTKGQEKSAYVVNEIPSYGVVAQMFEARSSTATPLEEVESLPTTVQLMKAQAREVLCRNLKEVVKKNRDLKVNENGLLCRRAPLYGAIKVILHKK